jgi:hypothetical protein
LKREVNARENDTLWYLPICQTDSVPDGIEPPSTREVRLVDVEDRVVRAADFIAALMQATIDVNTTESAEGDVSPEVEIRSA